MQKHKNTKEIISYLFFGALTTLVNLISFHMFNKFWYKPLQVNIVSWAISIAFAYLTNAKWVFGQKKYAVKSAIDFATARITTLLLEEAILLFGIDVFGFKADTVKIVAQILVIITNYLLSKFMVFNKNNERK